MKRTISIKLNTTSEQSEKLLALQSEFNSICNNIVPYVVDNRCWNRVALHHLTYYTLREQSKLGSQMVCNAIHKVCTSYKVLKIKKTEDVPLIKFKSNSSVHFDKKTYTINNEMMTLYTLEGRILVSMRLGDFQRQYLEQGQPKEAELIRKGKNWFFNLVLDIPDNPTKPTKEIMGVDVGENTIATLSNGKMFDGGQVRHERDKFLNRRKKLQSNGSKSSKRLLKRISGREQRHVKDLNHQISKAIVQEAVSNGYDSIAMEDLTHIRKNIKAGKRVRSRLHRWSWKQLQGFVEYKAKEAGLNVIYVNPAYTSKSCSQCGQIGIRKKHRFHCKSCEIYLHSDCNAAINIRKIAGSAELAMAIVN